MAVITWSPELSMDAALAARIIDAIRALYPEVVTEGMTDSQIGKAWVKRQVRELLAQHAERVAADNPAAAAKAAADAVWAEVRAAGTAARDNAETGIDLTP